MNTYNQKIYSASQLVDITSDETLHDYLSDWFVLVRILMKAVEMSSEEGSYQPYDQAVMEARLKKTSVLDQNPTFFSLKDGANEFYLQTEKGMIMEKSIIEEACYFQNETILESYFTQRMKEKGSYAYMRSYDEFLHNNLDNLAERLAIETPVEQEQLPKMYNKDKQIIVDCSRLPGYDFEYQSLRFTSCWKMWYSDAYFSIIPKSIFTSAQQVQQITELSPNLVYIELYKQPFSWKLPINQGYQQLFRDQLGFDQFSCQNGVGILKEPYIDYYYSNEGIQTIQYQNNNFQPVNKRAATHFTTREYLKDGEESVYRNFGFLTSAAYFPMQDEMHKSMLNYRVINPEYMVDDGLHAYEFYIRHFFDIPFVDQQYQEYSANLRFYLPVDYIERVPLEKLKKVFPSIKFKNFEKKKFLLSFEMSNEKNHLNVFFLDFQLLELNTEEERKKYKTFFKNKEIRT